MPVSNDSRFDRLEGKVDDLQDRLNENHLDIINRIEKLSTDTVQKIHTVETTVNKHEQHFSTLNKIFLSGGILSLVSLGAWFKDFFLHK